MKKIAYNELVNSISYFFIQEDVDNKFLRLRVERADSLRKEMKDINAREGLELYIRNYEDSIENILTVLGVSQEFFKRIVSFFRQQKGQVFNSEWSVKQVRNFAISDSFFMEKICNLFLGKSDESVTSNVPGYRLRNFIINSTVMKRLENVDFLDFLIRKDFDTPYNSALSACNAKKLESYLYDLTSKNNFGLTKDENVDPIGNGTRNIRVNYTITVPGQKLPSYYIKYSFNITTAKGQTDFKRSVQDLRNYIRNKNAEAVQIVILDGAGWIGRQSDLREVWDFSDYCLTLKTLDNLKDIIKI